MPCALAQVLSFEDYCDMIHQALQHFFLIYKLLFRALSNLLRVARFLFRNWSGNMEALKYPPKY